MNGKSKPLVSTKSFAKKCKICKYVMGKCLIGKVSIGKCPVKKLSGQVYVCWRGIHRGNVSRGSVLGEVSVRELSSWETVLQSICQTSDFSLSYFFLESAKSKIVWKKNNIFQITHTMILTDQCKISDVYINYNNYVIS